VLDGAQRLMTAQISVAQLRRVRSLDDVLKLLHDELDWPIEADELDKAVFDYKPEELGIPAERVPQLTSIRQLQPLTLHQPWGMFFLEFTGPRLPITPLRRLLQSLVTKSRARVHHRTWDLEHLLFVITTDSGDSVELHLVAFFDTGVGLAEIRSLAWRPRQSPQQYLDRLGHELLPRLAWPADVDDAAAWTDEWRSAFTLRHGEAIATAERLAERMAEVATVLRKAISKTLAEESSKGPFHALLNEVRHELVAGVDEARFADMCAQTLVYGTLTARVTDPIGFGASPTLVLVPLANPFLAAFFEQVHDQVADLDLSESGLEKLVADLRASNVEAVLDQFGSTAKGGDPVVHFYEEFLKRYDRQMRADAGAFYTPQPVVEFMVRAVDEVLKSSFGLAQGLADPSDWANVARYLGIQVPKGIKPTAPFLSMLDPATGTGTYLVEWLRRARRSFETSQPSQNWPARLKDFVIPSMHAFELMLAPYAIAHLKVAIEMNSQGLVSGEPAIHLTDTLEYPAAQAKFETMQDPVALEGERAAALKEHERFTVIVGNPPYDREQREVGDVSERKGGIVRHGVPGLQPLIVDFLAPLKAAGLSASHSRSLYNDYVYFWRWAAWQAVQRPPGPGIVAFITAASYLEGVSFSGMRQFLREQFDELNIVDLGGDSMSALWEHDENVFDIRIPVAICVAVRRTPGNASPCAVRYTRVTGTRGEKFAVLRELRLDSPLLVKVEGSGTDPFVFREGVRSGWVSVSDLMPWSARGIQFSRTWPIAPSRSVAVRRWEALRAAPSKSRAELLHESGDTKVARGYSSFLGNRKLTPLAKLRATDEPDAIREIAYRTFDRQFCIADRRVIDRPRPPRWTAQSNHQVFLVTLAGAPYGNGPQAMATPLVPDLNAFQGFGGGLVHPFWRDGACSTPNVTGGALEVLTRAFRRAVDPIDLFAYMYGILGTAALSEQQRRDGYSSMSPPFIPITANSSLFGRVCHLGRDLLWWHTFGERLAPEGVSGLPASGAKETEPVRGYPESYSYEAATCVLSVGTGCFADVSPEAWSFEVSGLKVLQSWLGYRMASGKGKKSSALDDIRPERWTFSDELLRVVAIIQHTVDLTPRAAELLARVLSGKLIDRALLPEPTAAERNAPAG